MQVVPITNDARQTFTTIVNGQLLKVTAWYQTVGAGWFVTLEMPDSEVLVQGARLNSQTPVLYGLVNGFNGDLVPTPIKSPYEEIPRQAWGITHQLLYITGSEMEELSLAPV